VKIRFGERQHPVSHCYTLAFAWRDLVYRDHLIDGQI